MDSEREVRNLREFYSRDGPRAPIGKMNGEMPDIIRLAIRQGVVVGFTLNLSRKTIFAVPVAFNDFTGRITVKVGNDGHSPYVRSFGIRHVKEFQFAWELWEEYRRQGR